MRKILLATTAFVGFAVAGAQAATTPLTVNVGGSVDFVAANFAGSDKGVAGAGDSANRSFETLFDLNFDIKGKSNSGVEYGGVLGLSNAPDIRNNFSGTTTPYMDSGYVWMSGAFGKVQLGDSHGATDLAVTTPVTGEGQVMGRFFDFVNTKTFAKNFVTGVDGTDHSTNATYFTPKVGNESNKVQLGVTYAPRFYNYGSEVATNDNGAIGTGSKLSPYQDVFKGALAYEGQFAPVAVKASASIINGSSDDHNTAGLGQAWILNAPTGDVQNFTSYSLGAQAAAEGFTLGGAYTDQGKYDTVAGQNRAQDQFTAGLKYDFSKASVGVSYLGARGYSNLLSTAATASASTTNYIKDYTSYGAGGSYVWAPGLTSNVDGVIFNQKSDAAIKNDGYVLLVSQKLAF